MEKVFSKKSQSLRFDFIFLLALIGVGYIYSTITAGSLLGESLIGGAVFILPGVAYLGWRKPKKLEKNTTKLSSVWLVVRIFFRVYTGIQ